MVEDDGSGGASVQLPEQEVEGDRGGVMGHGGGASRLGSPSPLSADRRRR